MTIPLFRRFRFAPPVLAAVVVFAAIGVAGLLWNPSKDVAPKTAPSQQDVGPSLNCAFYDFTNSRLIIGFDFAVVFPAGSPPRFEERAEGTGTSETHKTFEPGERPIWTYGTDDETPVITSPDGATRIVLYGLKLETDGVFFIEAGVRSNEYRNLGGQCRQINLTGKQAGDADGDKKLPAAAP